MPVPERHEDLAAAVMGDRARPGQPEPDPAGQAAHDAPSTGASVTTIRCTTLPGSAPAGSVTGAGPSALPTWTPPTTSSSRAPKLVISGTCGRVLPDHAGRRPMQPLKPRQDNAGAGSLDGALVRRRRGAALVALDRRVVRRHHVLVLDLHPACVVEVDVVGTRRPRDDEVGGARRVDLEVDPAAEVVDAAELEVEQAR